MAKVIETKQVKVNDLTPHPDNPNRGDVAAISRSLERFGQYRPIVANKDGIILAGHHVWEAAKSVGFKEVLTTLVDVDDEEARRILLADNRIADLGPGPDLEMLLQNLEILSDDLESMGFDADYLRMLEEAVEGPPELEELENEVNEKEAKPEDFYRRLTIMVEPKDATRWEAHKKMFPDDNEAFHYLLSGAREEEPAQ